MAKSNLEQNGNSVKMTITVEPEEQKPHLEAAAADISQETKIDGFRPGKADYETVKKRVGEMKIMEAALENIVRQTYIEALNEHDLETAGEPKFKVDVMVPGQSLIYTVEVALMPKVTKIADWKNLSVDKQEVKIEDTEIEKALEGLAKMQTKEVREDTDTEATKEHKVVIDMDMKKDGVAVEGGQAKDNAVFMAEDHYVPGFCDELLGLKEGDKKTFTLKFPAEHYQKNLSGANVEFAVTVKEIYRLESPVVDDKFATTLGQKDLATLKEMMKTNMVAEKEREEVVRQERTMLEMVAEKSEFEEIPDSLLNEEIHKMVHELEHAVEDQGGKFEDYLKSIGKTLADLKLDVTPEAMKRLKVALLIREIAKTEDVKVDDKELDAELDKIAEQYEDKEVKKKVYSPMNREYVFTMMRNRKVIEMLKETMIK